MANIRTAMNRGAFDFLTKPIDFADFETTVRKTIAHVAALATPANVRRGRARACFALALFFAQSRPQPRGRRQCAHARRGTARGRHAVHRHRGVHAAGGIARSRALASLLSGYLEGMTEIVFAHEGTVAKIIGDAIHVLFGAPADQPDAASRAVACALALDACSEQYRREWKARGVPLGRRASACMPGRRSSAISAAGGSSTIPPMATPSTPPRVSRRSTSSLARASVSAPPRRSARTVFSAARSAIWCCGGAASRCGCSSR